MFKGLCVVFSFLLILSVWVYFADDRPLLRSPMDVSASIPKPTVPRSLKIQGIRTAPLFEEMAESAEIHKLVVNNPIPFGITARDSRIYQIHRAVKLYKYYCYKVYTDADRMDTMKRDFLEAFLRHHHECSETYLIHLKTVAANLKR